MDSYLQSQSFQPDAANRKHGGSGAQKGNVMMSSNVAPFQPPGMQNY